MEAENETLEVYYPFISRPLTATSLPPSLTFLPSSPSGDRFPDLALPPGQQQQQLSQRPLFPRRDSKHACPILFLPGGNEGGREGGRKRRRRRRNRRGSTCRRPFLRRRRCWGLLRPQARYEGNDKRGKGKLKRYTFVSISSTFTSLFFSTTARSILTQHTPIPSFLPPSLPSISSSPLPSGACGCPMLPTTLLKNLPLLLSLPPSLSPRSSPPPPCGACGCPMLPMTLLRTWRLLWVWRVAPWGAPGM